METKKVEKKRLYKIAIKMIISKNKITKILFKGEIPVFKL